MTAPQTEAKLAEEIAEAVDPPGYLKLDDLRAFRVAQILPILTAAFASLRQERDRAVGFIRGSVFGPDGPEGDAGEMIQTLTYEDGIQAWKNREVQYQNEADAERERDQARDTITCIRQDREEWIQRTEKAEAEARRRSEMLDEARGLLDEALPYLRRFSVGDRVSAFLKPANPAPTVEPPRCNRTGNPCGTDTWAIGYECPCPTCTVWLKGAPKEAGEGPSGKIEDDRACGWNERLDPPPPERHAFVGCGIACEECNCPASDPVHQAAEPWPTSSERQALKSLDSAQWCGYHKRHDGCNPSPPAPAEGHPPGDEK